MIPLVFHGHMRDLCSQGCRNKTMSFPLALKANEECIYSTREDAYTRRETIKTGIKHKEMLYTRNDFNTTMLHERSKSCKGRIII